MSLVLKNGIVVGSANLTVIIGGVIITGIKKLDYKVSQNKENIKAFQKQPVGRGRGSYEYGEGSMDILKEEYKSIIQAAPNRDPFQIEMFNIPIVYDNSLLQGEVLNNVEFTGASDSHTAGDTALWVSVSYIWAGLNQ